MHSTSALTRHSHTPSSILVALVLLSAGTLAMSGRDCPQPGETPADSDASHSPPSAIARLQNAERNGVWIDLNNDVVLVAPRGGPCPAHVGTGARSCIPIIAGDHTAGHRVTYIDGRVEEFSAAQQKAVETTPGDVPSMPPAVTVLRAFRHDAGDQGYGVVELEHTPASGLHRRYRVHWGLDGSTRQKVISRYYLVVEGLTDSTDLYREVQFIGEDWPLGEFPAMNRRRTSQLSSEVWIDRSPGTSPPKSVGLITSPANCVSMACGEEVLDCIQTRACFMEQGWKLMFAGGTSREADRYFNCCTTDAKFDRIVDSILTKDSPLLSTIELSAVKRLKTCGFDRNGNIGVIADMTVAGRFYRLRAWGPPSTFPTGWTIHVHLIETRLDPQLTLHIDVERLGDPWDLYP